jgi:sugar lactone lactonase YvrE
MPKPSAALAALTLVIATDALALELSPLWETEAVLPVSESVRFDAQRKLLYVSNIDGEPWAADGKGSIAKVGLDGKVIDVDWISGLDCPKGLALVGKQLYVGDAKGLQVIDVEKGAIVETIVIEGSVGLNDVAADDNGVIYVSDMKARRVHAVEGGKVRTVLENLKAPNGVLVDGGTLYVLDDDSLFRVGADGAMTRIADGMPGGVDGLESLGDDEFLVSVWSGALWWVRKDGSKALLFDGKAEKTSTADIGWDPVTRTLYVPTFGRNTVRAYAVK